MIVTIDGPAGSGKSTAARLLAQRLGVAFLDTGAMYRAIAWAALRDHIEPSDSLALRAWLASLVFDADVDRLRLDGIDIRDRLRTPEIASLASSLAVLAPVRSYLVELQRKAAKGRDLVCEGRDQGTVVFPQAEHKFFLTADRIERARRRHREMAERGLSLSFEDVLLAQDERDQRDAERALAPLVPASDAVRIDTTQMSLEQVVAKMEAAVRRCSS
jgi:cytidylate kinase